MLAAAFQLAIRFLVIIVVVVVMTLQSDCDTSEAQNRFQNVRRLLRVDDPNARTNIASSVIVARVEKLVT